MDNNETINHYDKLFDMKKQLDSHTFWGWKLLILSSEKLFLGLICFLEEAKVDKTNNFILFGVIVTSKFLENVRL